MLAHCLKIQSSQACVSVHGIQGVHVHSRFSTQSLLTYLSTLAARSGGKPFTKAELTDSWVWQVEHDHG
jgi:hypothetical protein